MTPWPPAGNHKGCPNKNERTENVYENKGTLCKTARSDGGARRVARTRPKGTKCLFQRHLNQPLRTTPSINFVTGVMARLRRLQCRRLGVVNQIHFGGRGQRGEAVDIEILVQGEAENRQPAGQSRHHYEEF